jgi:hypothetical protein
MASRTDPEEEAMADIPQWRLAGDWFDVCRCRVPCACTFAQAPDDGQCDGVLAWHVREGNYGDVALEWLNVVAVRRRRWLAGRLRGADRGIEYAPIEFQIADDLAQWRVEVPGKARGSAEALTGADQPGGSARTGP